MGSTIGTPAFMSPEQAIGQLDQVGPASDIYGLGATLYVLLTGRAPITGEDRFAVLARARRGDFLPPAQAKAGVPPPLDAICCKAMALKPGDRYASAQDLAADIEHWLADDPVAIYREPLYQRLGRWGRRHRTTVASSAALLVTAVVALGIGLAAVNAEREKTEQALGSERQARLAEEEQREEADRQRKEAVAREEETKAVLRFVQDAVLATARRDGLGGLGPDVTLQNAVEAALPKVANSFTNRPLVEAEIRRTLGAFFWYFEGGSQTATDQLEAARALFIKHRGFDDPDTLSCMSDLA